MQTGGPDEPDESEGIADAGDDFPDPVKVVGVVFELGQLLDLVVLELRPLVGIVARIIFLGRVLFEPLALSIEQVLDVLSEEMLAEVGHLGYQELVEGVDGG